MDGKRFDDISKVLGAAVTRQNLVQVLAGLGAAGLSALTGFELGEAKKGHGRGKHNKKNDHHGDQAQSHGQRGAQAASKHHKGKKKHKKNAWPGQSGRGHGFMWDWMCLVPFRGPRLQFPAGE